MSLNYKFEGLQYTHNKYKSKLASFDSMPFFRCGILAGYSGIIQSSIWIIISLIFIVVYKSQNPYTKFHYCNIVTIFFDTFIRKCDDNVSTKVIFIMSINVFFSTLWLLSSIWLLFALHYLRWPSDTKRMAYNSWAAITLKICFFDFLFAMIFIIHFVKNMDENVSSTYRSFYSLDIDEQVTFDDIYFENYIICVVIFLLFVLRGIIIWGLNLMYSAVIISMNFISKKNLKTSLSSSSRKTQTERIFPLERTVNMTESKSLYSKGSRDFLQEESPSNENF